jgi:hypothetical protein
VVVDSAHVEDRRGPGEEHLGQAELGARGERGVVVRRLERPDAALEPVEKRQVVRHPAKERLAEVHVSLDETGDDGASRRVDHARQGGELERCATAGTWEDRVDLGAADEHVRFEDAGFGVTGDDESAADEGVQGKRRLAPHRAGDGLFERPCPFPDTGAVFADA